MTLRLGLLSTARVNRRIIAAAAHSERVEVVAVASRDAARADTYATEHAIPRAYGGYDTLLADPDVEAVYVSLPNAMHVEWTLRSLEAGKHVLVEKPFSRRVEDVEAAFDLAERRRLVLTEAFMWRHHPQTARLLEIVASGVLGPLRVVRAAFSFPLATVHGADDARFDAALDGGALMDVGCYCVSALRLFAGEPERVHGEQYVGPSGVDLVFTGALRFADGVVGHFDCGFVLPFRAEIEIVGEHASVFANDPWLTRAPGFEIRRRPRSEGPTDVERVHVDMADSYRLELEDLADAVAMGRPPLLGRADAVGQAGTIDALYQAAASSP